MSKRIACITCDVEIKSTGNIDNLKNIIDLLNKYGISGTLFLELTNNNIDLYKTNDLINHFQNHELGLHIHWTDSRTKGLENLILDDMRKELENSLDFSKELGFKPVSFRGGGLCCTNASLRLIKEYGFKIDSSVAAKLNESGAWFQNHTNVPYKSWYYPSKQSYDIPALVNEDRQGILEVPVTRMIPSGRQWYPWALTPQTPFFKFIVTEWIIKSKWEPITAITPIFHSWGEGKLRVEKGRFSLFTNKLENSIKFMLSNNFEFMKLRDFQTLIESIK